MTRKTAFFEGWSWFKFNNLGLALGTNLKFYTSLSKGLKLKVRKFWRLILTFAEVTEENLEIPILNRVNITLLQKPKKTLHVLKLTFSFMQVTYRIYHKYREKLTRKKNCPLNIEFIRKHNWRIFATSLMSLCLAKGN